MITDAKALMDRAKELQVEGCVKLQRRIKAELAYLQKLQKSSMELKENHLRSSNLTHLRAIITTAESLPAISSLLHPFHFTDQSGNRVTLTVDVAANHGLTWVKVIARKAQAMHVIWLGEGQYGEKSVIDQAEDYIAAAADNPLKFSIPQVVFSFFNGITQPIADKLLELGVQVKGEIIAVEGETAEDDDSDDDEEENSCHSSVSSSSSGPLHTMPPPRTECQCLNLDVTTLLAMVSALTNGRSSFRFQEPILNQQAEWERERPLLSELNKYIKGRELIACESAVRDFHAILSTVGGVEEKDRAKQLLQKVKVVADQPSDRAERLELSGRVKERAKVIFGTGDSLHAVTVTANSSFVRAAANQASGVVFSVFEHESRALTEQKEKTATLLDAEDE
uniref:DUF1308 domain-containing protein n=1 Tax=Branchiostoma floridae TaxID=7739 RepID=C3ZLV9_BRAFL|eukprot:XP_002590429.1 hypothetical protein BRAFLDRAFT_62745 [Branchiostoma floridae]